MNAVYKEKQRPFINDFIPLNETYWIIVIAVLEKNLKNTFY